MTRVCIVAAIALLGTAMIHAAEPQSAAARPKILVHITHGPEQPTRAALGFLVARTAIEQGHAVSIFLAGDAVQLLREATLDSIAGVGTGRLREHYDAIVKGGGRFYLSGMSSAARGVSDLDLKGSPAEFAPPNVLLKLALEHDRMFTY